MRVYMIRQQEELGRLTGCKRHGSPGFVCIHDCQRPPLTQICVLSLSDSVDYDLPASDGRSLLSMPVVPQRLSESKR